MGQRMTWEEMKNAYPDEWLLIVDCESDDHDRIVSGIVERHSMDDTEVFRLPTLDKDCTFKYPATEFSDEALQFAGLFDEKKESIALKPGLQTQKYGKLQLHEIEICGHTIENLEVYVSHFDKIWGIKTLVGLDFFRRFKVTVDYKAGHLITEPYE